MPQAVGLFRFRKTFPDTFFNKAQQDAFLPFVEKGSIILIGATTENPSFEVNGALLSRCKVFVLQELKTEELCALLKHALTDPRGFGGQTVEISDGLIASIAAFAILGGETGNAPRNIHRVLARFQHARKPIDRRVRVGVAHRLMQGGNYIVMLLPVLVVQQRFF